MLILYHFPISHYCEKARWALEYKKLEHRKVTLLPGLHIPKLRKMTGKTQVPVLKENDRVIAGSANIIDYLDQEFMNFPLTPEDPELAARAIEWEQFADTQIGPKVRLLVYHIILDYSEITTPMMARGGPWYGSLYTRLAMPKLSVRMREHMDINEQTAAASFRELMETVDTLQDHYSTHEFMVGESFSRADLTAASLFAPLVMPEGYGVDWPRQIPDRLAELKAQFEGKLDWVNSLYQAYR